MTQTSIDKVQRELPDLMDGAVYQASISTYWYDQGSIMARIGDGVAFPIGQVVDGQFIPVD